MNHTWKPTKETLRSYAILAAYEAGFDGIAGKGRLLRQNKHKGKREEGRGSLALSALKTRGTR
jgi:hypothetical protein